MEKIEVSLSGLVRGCALIIPHPSGVVYGQRAAGGWRSLEGIYVPVDWDDAVVALKRLFSDDLTEDFGNADRVGAELKKHHADVSRSGLDQSCKGWVWLSLERGVRLIEQIRPAEVVLTWSNGD